MTLDSVLSSLELYLRYHETKYSDKSPVSKSWRFRTFRYHAILRSCIIDGYRLELLPREEIFHIRGMSWDECSLDLFRFYDTIASEGIR